MQINSRKGIYLRRMHWQLALQVNICSKVTIILIYISILNFSDYYTTMPPTRTPPTTSFSLKTSSSHYQKSATP